MDIGRAVQFWTGDPDWIKKVLIGGVLYIVPIIGWLIIGGYYIRTVQKVSAGSDTLLPEWDQWGEDLVRGLKLVGILLIWMLPLWIITICAVVLSIMDDTAGGFAGLLLNCLGAIYSIAFYFIFPILIGRFAANEDFSSAFDVSRIIQDAQKIPAQLLIFVVMVFALGFAAGLGFILCVIGVVFTSFIAYIIQAHLVAQLSNMLGYTSPQQQAPAPPPAM